MGLFLPASHFPTSWLLLRHSATYPGSNPCPFLPRPLRLPSHSNPTCVREVGPCFYVAPADGAWLAPAGLCAALAVAGILEFIHFIDHVHTCLSTAHPST